MSDCCLMLTLISLDQGHYTLSNQMLFLADLQGVDFACLIKKQGKTIIPQIVKLNNSNSRKIHLFHFITLLI